MSMTLYHGEPNGPSLTVLAALYEKQLDARLIRMDLAAGARHKLPWSRQPELAMSVEGEGPVLVVDDEAMTDSVFIGCYLDDVGAGPELRPGDPYVRWQTMAWCRQMIERTAPAVAYLGCQAHPPQADPAALAAIQSEDLRARWQLAVAGEFAADKLADSRAKIGAAVERLESRLQQRDWIMGSFSLADLESYAWLAGMAALVPAAFADRPRSAQWLQRVRARPSVAQALALASVARPEQSWAPGPEINRWG
ncbi:MAG TPA: glutathione S-transferase family protein [Steroidobacteraceae bacterium]|jgi:GST-like protein